MLRIGAVGVGVWGCHSLEQTFAAGGRARLVAVTTEDRWGDHQFSGDPLAHGRAYAERLGAEFEPDWRALVARPDVDVVSAMVCPRHKAAVIIAALTAGKHVITDKPLAMTASEAAAICAAEAASNGRGFMLAGFQNRPLVRHLADAVASGRLGALRSLSLRLCFMGGIFPGFRPTARWRSEIPSGELTTIGCHALTTLLTLHSSPIASVYAVTAKRFYPEYRAVGAEDWAELNLRFADGAVANVMVARLPHRIPREDILIEATGTDGYAQLGADGLTYWPGPETLPHPAGVDPLRETFAAVADALEQQRPPPVTFMDGWRLQAVLDAALQSAARRDVVPVAWPPGGRNGGAS